MELTVGRHAAGDGAGVDPIVAAALTQRPTGAETGIPRHGQDSGQLSSSSNATDGEGDGEDDGEGELGWPGEPGEGTGLGWPVDQLAEPPARQDRQTVTLGSEEASARRRSWRRLFSGGPATERRTAPSGNGAALSGNGAA